MGNFLPLVLEFSHHESVRVQNRQLFENIPDDFRAVEPHILDRFFEHPEFRPVLFLGSNIIAIRKQIVHIDFPARIEVFHVNIVHFVGEVLHEVHPVWQTGLGIRIVNRFQSIIDRLDFSIMKDLSPMIHSLKSTDCSLRTPLILY